VDVVLDNNSGRRHGVSGFVMDLVSNVALPHEIAHQWFYGIVATTSTHSLADEGFTDYATDLYRGVTGSGCGITWQSTAEKLTNSMAYWTRTRRGTPPWSTATASARCTICGG